MKRRYKTKKNQGRSLRKLTALFVLLFVLLIIGWVYNFYSFSKKKISTVPTAYIQPVEPLMPQPKTPLPWPTYGQSAYGTTLHGVLTASNKQDTAVPIASLAKIITALAVLKKMPLNTGELGPTFTLTQADADLYYEYLSKDGSVSAISVGQQMSQYHAMQAMLMASANNVTDSLVIWVFGSVDAYTKYANNMLKDMGLPNTYVADATGFLPQTVSTASEMTTIAIAYTQAPVLMEIAMQKEAVIPVTGTVKNYNSLLNTESYVGIKAGNTDEAGRCFISASIKNGKIYSVAVVLGADDIRTAIQDSHLLLASGDTSF